MAYRHPRIPLSRERRMRAFWTRSFKVRTEADRRLADALNVMASQVVHHHDVAGPQRRDEDLIEVPQGRQIADRPPSATRVPPSADHAEQPDINGL